MTSELESLLRVATERVSAGDRGAAITAYRNAIAMAPERADVHYELGVLLAAAHRDGEALRAFSAAVQRRADWPEPWLAQDQLLFARGRYAEAAGAFDAAPARVPGRLEASISAAKALTRAKRWSLAVPHLARARELAPASEEVWSELRALLLRLDRNEDAAADFRRFEAPARPSARTVVAALDASMQDGDATREAACLERALDWPSSSGCCNTPTSRTNAFTPSTAPTTACNRPATGTCRR
jgi:tetratricopeptide (TPR) repeat protein